MNYERCKRIIELGKDELNDVLGTNYELFFGGPENTDEVAGIIKRIDNDFNLSQAVLPSKNGVYAVYGYEGEGLFTKIVTQSFSHL